MKKELEFLIEKYERIIKMREENISKSEELFNKNKIEFSEYSRAIDSEITFIVAYSGFIEDLKEVLKEE